MTPPEFREHLDEVRQASIDARRARDRIRLAESNMVRIPSAGRNDVCVSRGHTEYDRMARRCYELQRARESAGAELARSVEVLRRFREELESSPLYDYACRALWSRYVGGLSYAKVAEEIGTSPSTSWRLVRDAEMILAEYMGVDDPPKR